MLKNRFVHRRLSNRLSFEQLERRLVFSAGTTPVPAFDDCQTVALANSVLAGEGELDQGQTDSTRASQAVNRFAYDLYRHFQSASGNLFLSPASISTALAMTFAGARGQTAEQMASVLRFGMEPGIHESFRSLLDSLTDDDRPFELALANSLWPQFNFPFREEFLAAIESNYGGHSHPLDYETNPRIAEEIIDAWVAEKTHDKIQNLVKGHLDELTRMVLTNAIYFKGQWATEFDPANTTSRPFRRSADDVIDVSMMNLRSTFRYSVQDGFQVLEMPYKGEELSMVILLGQVESSANDLSSETLDKVSNWLDAAPDKTDVIVKLPKFKTTISSELSKVLSGMGMPLAFDQDAADFTGMANLSPWERLYISKVLHKAFVEVNEEGTEAAAATAVVISYIGCFVAGTPVLTPDGEVPIERLRAGDLVLSRDEHDVEGEVQPQALESVFERHTEIVNLVVGGQTIRTTKEHPFFVKGRGWTPAESLRCKDLLATNNNRWVEVESVTATGKSETVYNMRVANHHTYFVGSKAWGFAVWAHNSYGAIAKPIEFTADRPFHFFIRDNTTSATLFMGRISDPLQEENDIEPVASEAPVEATTAPLVYAELDKNHDGLVTPLDALMIINHLNASKTVFAQSNVENELLFDNNDDGVVSPLDVLIIVNWLNDQTYLRQQQAIQDNSLLDTIFDDDDDDSLFNADE